MWNEVIDDFVQESFENIDLLEKELLHFEDNSRSEELVRGIFRRLHALKGIVGCLSFQIMESLIHRAEGIVEQLQKTPSIANKKTITLLLKVTDALRSLTIRIQKKGEEGKDLWKDLRKELAKREKELKEKISTLSESQRENFSSEERAPQRVSHLQREKEERKSLRIKTVLIDEIINLVGELVLVRNQFLRRTNGNIQEDTFQHLDSLTSHLQEKVMEARMKPIESIWNPFPRLVREVSEELDLQVELLLEGGETEIDRSLLEKLQEPLAHLVRNALVHGIEKPSERLEKGKKARGLIFIKAYHQGGNISIEISDDGRGIDWDQVVNRAVDLGLIDRDKGEELSEKEKKALLFHPGMSTASKKTNMAGRGMGMEVVKNKIDQLSGRLSLETQRDRGTTFSIQLPLTLTVIPALVFTSMDRYFTLPQNNLRELLHFEPHSNKPIEKLWGTPFLNLRGELLPLQTLQYVLGGVPFDFESHKDEKMEILIVDDGERPLALLVDSIVDTEEIVVKPLGPELSLLSLYSGATILGDGSLALILDPHGLAEEVGVKRREEKIREEEERDEREEKEKYLLFQLGQQRMALPFSQVDRVIKITGEETEETSEGEMLCLQDRYLPLLRLHKFFGQDEVKREIEEVLICYFQQGQIAFVVDKTLDLIQSGSNLQKCSNRRAIEGVIRLEDQLTSLLDLQALVKEFNPPLLSANSKDF